MRSVGTAADRHMCCDRWADTPGRMACAGKAGVPAGGRLSQNSQSLYTCSSKTARVEGLVMPRHLSRYAPAGQGVTVCCNCPAVLSCHVHLCS